MLTGGPSYWFHAIGGLPRPRPALPGSTDVDVAIVGGGFTGLWTAYYLKRADPSLRICILESEVCGFGASGRNGGWVCGAVAGFGDARTQAAIDDAVDEIGRVTAAEQIACDYHKGGALHVVNGPAQLPLLRGKPGWLEPAELDRRLRVAGALGGVFEPNYARVQPAALSRGLADVVERLGVGVYEATRVESIASGLARTAHGDVRASWVIRATEGYTPHLAGAPPRTLIPLRSTMIVTEPLPGAAWDEIGWRDAELVHDAAHSYVYIQRTADGRIAIGGRGRPYYFGSGHDSYGATGSRRSPPTAPPAWPGRAGTWASASAPRTSPAGCSPTSSAVRRPTS
jgi:glycine/D-amino acid oxidase-like deaminating enzyme